MWCKHCRQDVPGIAAVDTRQFCCARCGYALSTSADADENRDQNSDRGVLHGRTAHHPSAVDAAMMHERDTTPNETFQSPRPSPSPQTSQSTRIEDAHLWDDWELEDQLRDVAQLLHATASTGRGEPLIGALPSELLSASHPPRMGWHDGRPANAETDSAADDATHADPKPRGGSFAWSVLLVGTMTLACGGVLLGWSVVEGRHRLWDIGMPIALAGQAMLLVGLVLQVERNWLNNRAASDRLREVDEQLHDLQHTTTLLGTTRGSASAAFYAHLAEGASPHLLLSDLKSQMDMLAMKVSKSRG